MTLGLSVDQRAIHGIRFAASAPEVDRRRLLLVGGIHGDEPASTEAVVELVERLRSSPPDGASVWLIPALNPDGLVHNRKNNAHDVDLNRNFPARNFTRTHEAGYDPGPTPLSEPESTLLAALVKREAIDAVVSVHAPFACINFDGPAKAWAAAVSNASGWPVWESIGYETPGSLGTWLGVDCGIPILTVELPQGTLTNFRAAAGAALDMAIAFIQKLPLGNQS
jgi:murein peptide amidase A